MRLRKLVRVLMTHCMRMCSQLANRDRGVFSGLAITKLIKKEKLFDVIEGSC